MVLIDVLPRDNEGNIYLNPAGKNEDGEFINGSVDDRWLKTHFNTLSKSEVPLSDNKLNKLKSIGEYWEINVERWRREGII